MLFCWRGIWSVHLSSDVFLLWQCLSSHRLIQQDLVQRELRQQGAVCLLKAATIQKCLEKFLREKKLILGSEDVVRDRAHLYNCTQLYCLTENQ